MNSLDAQTFVHRSKINAKILENTCPKCKAYKDWFTYNRWDAQNFQVKKGQHGTTIKSYHVVEMLDKNGKVKEELHPHTARVFCRCQVKES